MEHERAFALHQEHWINTDDRHHTCELSHADLQVGCFWPFLAMRETCAAVALHMGVPGLTAELLMTLDGYSSSCSAA
jgi:hypothetical protein